MKIIFLNAWGERMRDTLGPFITAQSHDTDIFCFQEAYDEMKRLARGILLADYQEIECYKSLGEVDNFPQATYVKKSISMSASGTIMNNKEMTGLGVYVQVPYHAADLSICNFHGLWRPPDKRDDPARLRQSRTLIDFFKDKPGAKIIGGDFNLLPDTKSITMFQEAGYRDLIKEYGIPTTRNQLAWEQYPDNKQYYSDYVFVSPEVKVKSFSVPDLAISDHLPLILEIE